MKMSHATTVSIDLLHEDPRHDSLYGDDAIDDLLVSIPSGIRVPLRVVPHSKSSGSYRLLSGHRRFRAAKQLGLTEVPCVILNDLTKEDELREILISNQSRRKTNLQTTKEAELWWDMLSDAARDRQGKRVDLNNADTDIPENLPECSDTGDTRDQVAKLVGMGSGKTIEKGVKVLSVIKDIRADKSISNADIKVRGLERILNESFDSAYKVIRKLSDPQLHARYLTCLGWIGDDNVPVKNIKEAEAY